MIITFLRRVGVDPGPIKAGASRAPLVVLLIIAAGIVAAVAAATASGPFASARPATHPVANTSRLVRNAVPTSQINASTLYPPPTAAPTVQQVVHVYDLPAPAPAGSRSGGSASESSARSPQHKEIRPTPEPSETPGHDHSPPSGGPTPPGDH